MGGIYEKLASRSTVASSEMFTITGCIRAQLELMWFCPMGLEITNTTRFEGNMQPLSREGNSVFSDLVLNVTRQRSTSRKCDIPGRRLLIAFGLLSRTLLIWKQGRAF